MKKYYKLFVVLAILSIVSFIVMFGSKPITIRKAKNRVEIDYQILQEQFVNFINVDCLKYKNNDWNLNFNGVVEYNIPKCFSEKGIDTIYSSGGNFYFEYSDSIFGTTPFGILYIQNSNQIDEWYKVEHIEDSFYFYRIVS